MTEQDARQRSILIVDDQIDNQKLIVNVLKADYRVLVAISGESALALLNSGTHPDLILLDIMMPGMDGYETCRQIKARFDLARIPIIFLTARVDTESETRGFTLGAVDYITKPINPPVLRARIAAQIALSDQLRHATRERDHHHRIAEQVSRERDEIGALVQRLEHEIAEREHVEKRLRMVSEAVTQAPVSILITDAEGSIVYVNPFFSRVTGYAAEEVIGQNPRVLKSGKVDADTYRSLWETVSTGQTWYGELLNKNRQGELFWESAAISPILDADGVITHYVAVKEHIGDRKELERIKDDVERIMRHDLKSPLSAIIGWPELLLMEESLSEEQREWIGLILEAGVKMRDMIDLSLDLFKMELGGYEPVSQPLDVLPMIDDLITLNRARLAEQELSLMTTPESFEQYPGGTCQVFCEARLLFSLLNNLLSNAIEASPYGETIWIDLVESQDAVELTLRNCGAVPEAIRTYFFEKYRTYGKRGGTGLGTYSAKLMADAMGIELTMETSDADDTTSIHLKLPMPV